MIYQRFLSRTTHLAMAGSAVASTSPVRVNSASGKFTGSATSPAVVRDFSCRASSRSTPGNRTDSSASLRTVNVLFSAAGKLARIFSRCVASIQRINSDCFTTSGASPWDRKAAISSAETPRLESSAAVNGCIAAPGRAHRPALVAEGTPSNLFQRNSAIGDRQRFAVQTKSIFDTPTAYAMRMMCPIKPRPSTKLEPAAGVVSMLHLVAKAMMITVYMSPLDSTRGHAPSHPIRESTVIRRD